MSNQRQLGVGFANYFTIQDDRLPVLDLKFLPGLSGIADNQKHWYYQLNEVGAFDAAQYDGSITWVRWSPAYFCPNHLLVDASGVGKSDKYWAAYYGLISYGMSDTLFRNFETPAKLYEPPKLIDIDQPSNTILLGDSETRTGANPLQNGGAARMMSYWGDGPGVVYPRHDRAAAILWVDGHVSNVKSSTNSDHFEALYKGMYAPDALHFRSVGASRFAPYYWDRRKR